ncbi:Uncharacterised protein [uncultured Ruminococcus sp.]|uniref:DUF4942 domain-containing protein n=1 Tax=Hydrogeniiclostridium mannosilyticum TaxID=2764322 RepID=A0A328UBC1_9FIRM|nr:hypothetical protein [Hydrogeniiclostridium mannosilyticum]RAQ28677.1 hypothetical protein DPQ25_07725 [Hydrogeniiclostridium mannosilyticum]SCH34647.1 Uncharacterised protein [uncultured Ruminococcus sp.]
MNALDKLDAVQITEDNRISEKDLLFCKAHQEAYTAAKTALTELEYIWTDIVSRQAETLKSAAAIWNNVQKYAYVPHFSTEKIHEQMELLHDIFISNLVRYFNNRYHVCLDVDSIIDLLLPHKPKSDYLSPNTEAIEEYHQKLRSMKVDYKDVLDQIFIQLGGRTFLERAVDEIKERCHKAAWSTYSGKAEYELKNDTIRFTYGCQFSDLFGKWELTDSMEEILRGMAYFESEILGYYPASIENLLGWNRREDPIFEFASCAKFQSLRMFKNGRVDVKFKNKGYASKFVSEFLGLVC